jgi:hypothetical protein
MNSRALHALSDNPDFDDRWFRALAAAAHGGMVRAEDALPDLHEFDAVAWGLAA